MVARAALALLVLLTFAGVLGSAFAQEPGDDGGSVGGGPPPPPPPPDPAAGPAAFLGESYGRGLLLDGQGRVVRVRPRLAERVVACPGSRRLVETGDWTGDLVVRQLGGRRLWRQRIPIQPVMGLECLDRGGRQVALVTESDEDGIHALRIASRRGVRTVLRARNVALLTPERLYITTLNGAEVRTVPGGRLVGRLPRPASAHDVKPSPDGRRLVMTHLTEGLRLRSWLVDARTGAARRIAIPRLTVLGWVAKDRLAVRSDGKLRILDLRLRERKVVDGFGALGAAITRAGDIVTTDGTALLVVRRGWEEIERIGTVPEGVSVDAALR